MQLPLSTRCASSSPDPVAPRSVDRIRAFVAGVALASIAVLAPVGAAGAAEPAIPRSPRPERAQVYFISPENGAKVASPVVVRFGLREMGVAPAGVAQPQTGHHHLIVDAEVPPTGLPIPKNDHYLHFGGGQTEVSLPLAPGKHTLQLLLGDHNHVPHDPPVVSERITIEVAK
jgi:hypothetical protein